jgi:hypothetical protein
LAFALKLFDYLALALDMLAALSNALLRPSKISFQQIAFHTSQRTEHRTDAPLVVHFRKFPPLVWRQATSDF